MAAAQRIRWDRLGRWALLFVLALVLYLYIGPARTGCRRGARPARSARRSPTLRAENERLRARRDELKRASALEREARRLGMVKAGERAYIVEGLPKPVALACGGCRSTPPPTSGPRACAASSPPPPTSADARARDARDRGAAPPPRRPVQRPRAGRPLRRGHGLDVRPRVRGRAGAALRLGRPQSSPTPRSRAICARRPTRGRQRAYVAPRRARRSRLAWQAKPISARLPREGPVRVHRLEPEPLVEPLAASRRRRRGSSRGRRRARGPRRSRRARRRWPGPPRGAARRVDLLDLAHAVEAEQLQHAAGSPSRSARKQRVGPGAPCRRRRR